MYSQLQFTLLKQLVYKIYNAFFTQNSVCKISGDTKDQRYEGYSSKAHRHKQRYIKWSVRGGLLSFLHIIKSNLKTTETIPRGYNWIGRVQLGLLYAMARPRLGAHRDTRHQSIRELTFTDTFTYNFANKISKWLETYFWSKLICKKWQHSVVPYMYILYYSILAKNVLYKWSLLYKPHITTLKKPITCIL